MNDIDKSAIWQLRILVAVAIAIGMVNLTTSLGLWGPVQVIPIASAITRHGGVADVSATTQSSPLVVEHNDYLLDEASEARLSALKKADDFQYLQDLEQQLTKLLENPDKSDTDLLSIDSLRTRVSLARWIVEANQK